MHLIKKKKERQLIEQKPNDKKQKASRTADSQPRVEETQIKRMSCDLALNIRHVFCVGESNNYNSYCFFLTLKQIKGLASYFELRFWSKKEMKKKKSFLYYLKTTKISFPFPACKLVHCACVSVDCLVISFYDNLHSFVVRDLAYSFWFNIVYY